jgi:hypothetical protein
MMFYPSSSYSSQPTNFLGGFLFRVCSLSKGEERGEQPISNRNERSEPRADQRSEPRSDQPRSEQRNYRSSYPGQYDRILGMGDHVPDFILRSFRLRDVTPDDDEGETTTAA